MSLNPIEYIRTKSREEWHSLFKEKWISARIWIQENGEFGFGIAFACGILFVLFFKLLFGTIIFLALLGFLAWSIAEPASAQSKSSLDKITTIKVEDSKSQVNGSSIEH